MAAALRALTALAPALGDDLEAAARALACLGDGHALPGVRSAAARTVAALAAASPSFAAAALPVALAAVGDPHRNVADRTAAARLATALARAAPAAAAAAALGPASTALAGHTPAGTPPGPVADALVGALATAGLRAGGQSVERALAAVLSVADTRPASAFTAAAALIRPALIMGADPSGWPTAALVASVETLSARGGGGGDGRAAAAGAAAAAAAGLVLVGHAPALPPAIRASLAAAAADPHPAVAAPCVGAALELSGGGGGGVETAAATAAARLACAALLSPSSSRSPLAGLAATVGRVPGAAAPAASALGAALDAAVRAGGASSASLAAPGRWLVLTARRWLAGEEEEEGTATTTTAAAAWSASRAAALASLPHPASPLAWAVAEAVCPALPHGDLERLVGWAGGGLPSNPAAALDFAAAAAAAGAGAPVSRLLAAMAAAAASGPTPLPQWAGDWLEGAAHTAASAPARLAAARDALARAGVGGCVGAYVACRLLEAGALEAPAGPARAAAAAAVAGRWEGLGAAWAAADAGSLALVAARAAACAALSGDAALMARAAGKARAAGAAAARGGADPASAGAAAAAAALCGATPAAAAAALTTPSHPASPRTPRAFFKPGGGVDRPYLTVVGLNVATGGGGGGGGPGGGALAGPAAVDALVRAAAASTSGSPMLLSLDVEVAPLPPHLAAVAGRGGLRVEVLGPPALGVRADGEADDPAGDGVGLGVRRRQGAPAAASARVALIVGGRVGGGQARPFSGRARVEVSAALLGPPPPSAAASSPVALVVRAALVDDEAGVAWALGPACVVATHGGGGGAAQQQGPRRAHHQGGGRARMQ